MYLRVCTVHGCGSRGRIYILYIQVYTVFNDRRRSRRYPNISRFGSESVTISYLEPLAFASIRSRGKVYNIYEYIIIS